LAAAALVAFATMLWGNHPDEADNLVNGWLITKGFRRADAVASRAPIETDLAPSARATAA